jgi:hypothetical protein
MSGDRKLARAHRQFRPETPQEYADVSKIVRLRQSGATLHEILLAIGPQGAVVTGEDAIRDWIRAREQQFGTTGDLYRRGKSRLDNQLKRAKRGRICLFAAPGQQPGEQLCVLQYSEGVYYLAVPDFNSPRLEDR